MDFTLYLSVIHRNYFLYSTKQDIFSNIVLFLAQLKH